MNRAVGLRHHAAGQSGIALVVALLFLLVVTIISIGAASNSSLGLKMSSNLQEGYRSFQAAEAGIYAVMGLAGTGDDPFARLDENLAPFAGVSPHPLRNVTDPNTPAIDVGVYMIAAARECPRPATETGGSSVGSFDCDYYRVISEHTDPGQSRTKVELGVVKTVVGDSG